MALLAKSLKLLALGTALGLGSATWADERLERTRNLPAQPRPSRVDVALDEPGDSLPPLGGGVPLPDSLLAPHDSMVPPQRVSPPQLNHMYDGRTEGAFDSVGSYMDEGSLGPRYRPMYPYRADEYWLGHDADVEDWGDELELPYVRLGWFANVDVTTFKGKVSNEFSSGTQLDAVFPNNPVTLGTAALDWSMSPKFEVGYRFEHGLGDVRGAYRYISAAGQDPLPSFGGAGTLSSKVQIHVMDLDLNILEFNSEGLPPIFPLFKVPGRLGLGKPLTPGFLVPPLEIRWWFGMRVASLYYDSIGVGTNLREQIVNDFTGGGIHFGFDLNQRLPVTAPLFVHFRAEGSGIFGYLDQTFVRTQFLPVAAGAGGGVKRDGIGVPTANVELGLSYVPNWPCRDLRFLLAWQYEEWFSFADTADSNAELMMHGILFRVEHKF